MVDSLDSGVRQTEAWKLAMPLNSHDFGQFTHTF